MYDVDDIMMMKFKPLELMGERLSCLLRKSVFRWSVKAPIPQVWLVAWRIGLLSNSVTGDYTLSQF